MDFELRFNLDRDIRILEITDLQPVDWSQQRYVGRLSGRYGHEFGEEDLYEGCYRFIDKLVKDTNPDLILVLGDIVYGEFDDNGSNLLSIIKKMESYEIPWAPIFGNHDNESKKGVAWQCQQFEQAKHCLFKRNTISGNGNYSIGIFNREKLIRIIFMIDTNGCYNDKKYAYLDDYPLYNLNEKTISDAGIYDDQLDWIDFEASKYNVPKTICSHIANSILADQGFKNKYYETGFEKFTLGKEVAPLNNDFGYKGETIGGFTVTRYKDILKKNNFDTMFVGHDHVNSLSVLCDHFIRITYVIKTGIFDYHDDNLLGGTLFTISTKDSSYNIEHKFIK